MEVLTQPQRQYLYVGAVLHWSEVRPEVNMVLQVRHRGLECGAAAVVVEASAEAYRALLAEFVLPDEVVREVIVHQIRRCLVAEGAERGQAQRVAKQREAGVDIAFDSDIAGSRPNDAELSVGAVGQNGAFLLGQLSAHPQ